MPEIGVMDLPLRDVAPVCMEDAWMPCESSIVAVVLDCSLLDNFLKKSSRVGIFMKNTFWDICLLKQKSIPAEGRTSRRRVCLFVYIAV